MPRDFTSPSYYSLGRTSSSRSRDVHIGASSRHIINSSLLGSRHVSRDPSIYGSSLSLYLPSQTTSTASSSQAYGTSRCSSSMYYSTNRAPQMSPAMSRRDNLIRTLVRTSNDVNSHHFLSPETISVMGNSKDVYLQSSRKNYSYLAANRVPSRSFTSDLSVTSSIARSSMPYESLHISRTTFHDTHHSTVLERSSISKNASRSKEDWCKPPLPSDRPVAKYPDREDMDSLKANSLLNSWTDSETLDSEGTEEVEHRKKDSVKSNDSGIGIFTSTHRLGRKSVEIDILTTDDAGSDLKNERQNDHRDHKDVRDYIRAPSADEGVHLDSDEGSFFPYLSNQQHESDVNAQLPESDEFLKSSAPSDLKNKLNDRPSNLKGYTDSCQVSRRVRVACDKYVVLPVSRNNSASGNDDVRRPVERRRSSGNRLYSEDYEKDSSETFLKKDLKVSSTTGTSSLSKVEISSKANDILQPTVNKVLRPVTEDNNIKPAARLDEGQTNRSPDIYGYEDDSKLQKLSDGNATSIVAQTCATEFSGSKVASSIERKDIQPPATGALEKERTENGKQIASLGSCDKSSFSISSETLPMPVKPTLNISCEIPTVRENSKHLSEKTSQNHCTSINDKIISYSKETSTRQLCNEDDSFAYQAKPPPGEESKPKPKKKKVARNKEVDISEKKEKQPNETGVTTPADSEISHNSSSTFQEHKINSSEPKHDTLKQLPKTSQETIPKLEKTAPNYKTDAAKLGYLRNTKCANCQELKESLKTCSCTHLCKDTSSRVVSQRTETSERDDITDSAPVEKNARRVSLYLNQKEDGQTLKNTRLFAAANRNKPSLDKSAEFGSEGYLSSAEKKSKTVDTAHFTKGLVKETGDDSKGTNLNSQDVKQSLKVTPSSPASKDTSPKDLTWDQKSAFAAIDDKKNSSDKSTKFGTETSKESKKPSIVSNAKISNSQDIKEDLKISSSLPSSKNTPSKYTIGERKSSFAAADNNKASLEKSVKVASETSRSSGVQKLHSVGITLFTKDSLKQSDDHSKATNLNSQDVKQSLQISSSSTVSKATSPKDSTEDQKSLFAAIDDKKTSLNKITTVVSETSKESGKPNDINNTKLPNSRDVKEALKASSLLFSKVAPSKDASGDRKPPFATAGDRKVSLDKSAKVATETSKESAKPSDVGNEKPTLSSHLRDVNKTLKLASGLPSSGGTGSKDTGAESKSSFTVTDDKKASLDKCEKVSSETSKETEKPSDASKAKCWNSQSIKKDLGISAGLPSSKGTPSKDTSGERKPSFAAADDKKALLDKSAKVARETSSSFGVQKSQSADLAFFTQCSLKGNLKQSDASSAKVSNSRDINVSLEGLPSSKVTSSKDSTNDRESSLETAGDKKASLDKNWKVPNESSKENEKPSDVNNNAKSSNSQDIKKTLKTSSGLPSSKGTGSKDYSSERKFSFAAAEGKKASLNKSEKVESESSKQSGKPSDVNTTKAANSENIKETLKTFSCLPSSKDTPSKDSISDRKSFFTIADKKSSLDQTTKVSSDTSKVNVKPSDAKNAESSNSQKEILEISSSLPSSNGTPSKDKIGDSKSLLAAVDHEKPSLDKSAKVASENSHHRNGIQKSQSADPAFLTQFSLKESVKQSDANAAKISNSQDIKASLKISSDLLSFKDPVSKVTTGNRKLSFATAGNRKVSLDKSANVASETSKESAKSSDVSNVKNSNAQDIKETLKISSGLPSSKDTPSKDEIGDRKSPLAAADDKKLLLDKSVKALSETCRSSGVQKSQSADSTFFTRRSFKEKAKSSDASNANSSNSLEIKKDLNVTSDLPACKGPSSKVSIGERKSSFAAAANKKASLDKTLKISSETSRSAVQKSQSADSVCTKGFSNDPEKSTDLSHVGSSNFKDVKGRTSKSAPHNDTFSTSFDDAAATEDLAVAENSCHVSLWSNGNEIQQNHRNAYPSPAGSYKKALLEKEAKIANETSCPFAIQKSESSDSALFSKRSAEEDSASGKLRRHSAYGRMVAGEGKCDRTPDICDLAREKSQLFEKTPTRTAVQTDELHGLQRSATTSVASAVEHHKIQKSSTISGFAKELVKLDEVRTQKPPLPAHARKKATKPASKDNSCLKFGAQDGGIIKKTLDERLTKLLPSGADEPKNVTLTLPSNSRNERRERTELDRLDTNGYLAIKLEAESQLETKLKATENRTKPPASGSRANATRGLEEKLDIKPKWETERTSPSTVFVQESSLRRFSCDEISAKHQSESPQLCRSRSDVCRLNSANQVSWLTTQRVRLSIPSGQTAQRQTEPFQIQSNHQNHEKSDNINAVDASKNHKNEVPQQISQKEQTAEPDVSSQMQKNRNSSQLSSRAKHSANQSDNSSDSHSTNASGEVINDTKYLLGEDKTVERRRGLKMLPPELETSRLSASRIIETKNATGDSQEASTLLNDKVPINVSRKENSTAGQASTDLTRKNDFIVPKNSVDHNQGQLIRSTEEGLIRAGQQLLEHESADKKKNSQEKLKLSSDVQCSKFLERKLEAPETAEEKRELKKCVAETCIKSDHSVPAADSVSETQDQAGKTDQQTKKKKKKRLETTPGKKRKKEPKAQNGSTITSEATTASKDATTKASDLFCPFCLPSKNSEKPPKQHKEIPRHSLDDLWRDYVSCIVDSGKQPVTRTATFRKQYVIENFNLLKLLGQGGYGKVMLVELKGEKKYFALKSLAKTAVLKANDIDDVMMEKEILATVCSRHPYLCKLYCTFQSTSHLFLLMEYLSGGDMLVHILQTSGLSSSRTRFYAAEIVCALKFLHRQGIIYRDVKTDNICLDADGHIRLIDFGFCQLRVHRKECLPKSILGTVLYMAPEVTKGYHYNQAVDWWSLGVTLYEMLTGNVPFRGENEEEIYHSVCYKEAVYPSYLTQEQKQILQLLLNRDPLQRLGMPGCPSGDICDQPFFQSIDWQKLDRKELEPPFKPQLNSETDVSNFLSEFTNEPAVLTPPDKETDLIPQNRFIGFAYTNPMMVEQNGILSDKATLNPGFGSNISRLRASGLNAST